MKRIITFGDSHADHSFRGISSERYFYNSLSIYQFVSNYTMYGHIFRDYVNNANTNANAIFIISLGEIDARCLIHKQICTKNRDLDTVVSDLVNRYKIAIDQLFKGLPEERHKNIYVMSIVPTSEPRFIEHEYRQRGSLEERITYTEKLNKCIKESFEKEYNYLNVYDLYKGPEGSINQKYSEDGFHINDVSLIKDILDKI
jgi:lysophospholipase L1-like esterase